MSGGPSAYDPRVKFNDTFREMGSQFGGDVQLIKGQPTITINGHVLRSQTEADRALKEGLIDRPVIFRG